MMRDGKALQMGTSHELGQNFARVFDMVYLDDQSQQQLCWTTSWGTSTRMVGGLIMAHGDDSGLVVPPRLAPIQCVVLLVKDADGGGVGRRLAEELRKAGVRVELDARVDTSFGRRATDWELKGVPLRLEVGPRDLAEGNVTLVWRHLNKKEAIPLSTAVKLVTEQVDVVQAELLASATTRRDERTGRVFIARRRVGGGAERIRPSAVVGGRRRRRGQARRVGGHRSVPAAPRRLGARR